MALAQCLAYALDCYEILSELCIIESQAVNPEIHRKLANWLA